MVVRGGLGGKERVLSQVQGQHVGFGHQEALETQPSIEVASSRRTEGDR